MDRQKLIKLLIIVATISFFVEFLSKNASSEENTIWVQNPLPSARIYTFVTAPFGIFAGEYDARAVSPSPYNGVYSSFDVGESWNKSGLDQKGITGLAFLKDNLFASVYYTTSIPSGVYKSEDYGKTWAHTGISITGLSIAATRTSILFGTASQGLFKSDDDGGSWHQVIGSGFSPGIKAIATYNTYALAASKDNKVYLSSNNGETWEEVPFLKDKIIGGLLVNSEVVTAGTSNNTGMYRSIDKGKTWEKAESFGNKSSTAFTEIKGVIYATGYSERHLTYGVFKTADLGLTWFDISYGLDDNNANIEVLIFAYGKEDKILASSTANAVFEYKIPKPQAPITPFLELPWFTSNFKLDAQNISSFFDHRYPFLGYPYKSEEYAYKDTTMNFMGIEKAPPYLWYSSHNGIDFPLPYGTKVLASADGYASYSYGSGTGNMIRIDHGNGFETWNMHLQDKELIVSKPGEKVFVKKLDKIGLVGMTGNTSGPHIHFSVLRDVNGDNEFNDFPDGMVDPYGWEGSFNDPWKNYTWEDSKGTHHGSESFYLWTINLDGTSSVINRFPATLEFGNKTLAFSKGSTEKSGTIEAKDFPIGGMTEGDYKLLIGSSFKINAYSVSGEGIKDFDNDYTITIDFSGLNTSNANLSSLSLLRLNEEDQKFTPVSSAVDLNAKKLTAQTNTTGSFAVFGLPLDTTPPQTLAEKSGDGENGVFKSDVLVTLTANDGGDGTGVDSIFFSLDGGGNWENYVEPLVFDENGTYTLSYKTLDKAGNLEEVKSIEFVIQKAKFSKTVRVVGAGFEAGNF
ncbi:hypothetical protein A2716_01840 [candidate division WWE3 bacterium RIFCSPHIGHO2_01_FULL_40_23]|uniref:M23ase beta-sheet core domain-containing protein n=1 Tax=candidate division WWE3 bacterium RIFCSPLOWO2_01_FULL_41_18 TaxID=1802625 RepID=A0A1F4VEQ3_UNCKA|nr:MAG: hypothetical protein A2716_01840 [candidate division WWE3 bacterium RIFCSPHIGHO2_01_FULL_40_23]OGC55731.1 MAG: hypothetical protein A3A78_01690 [candidate division WWE3 bacterium RIFCSPLOWO2_01_FULL_41_18]